MKKKGEVLLENIIFIILNVAFFTILVLFLLKQANGASLLEETTSKQIALLVDSSSPGMLMKLNMDKQKKIAENNGMNFEDIITFQDNHVIVKLSGEGGYEYPFFKGVRVNAYPEGENSGNYVFVISKG